MFLIGVQILGDVQILIIIFTITKCLQTKFILLTSVVLSSSIFFMKTYCCLILGHYYRDPIIVNSHDTSSDTDDQLIAMGTGQNSNRILLPIQLRTTGRGFLQNICDENSQWSSNSVFNNFNEKYFDIDCI